MCVYFLSNDEEEKVNLILITDYLLLFLFRNFPFFLLDPSKISNDAFCCLTLIMKLNLFNIPILK